MYFKITNKEENHNGFQYKDGLNILMEEFNDDPDASCCSGGFYFTDIKNIFKFIDYGIYLREIILPKDNKDFKMIKDKMGDKWRANMIILGNKMNLWEVDTFKYLVEKGADIHANDEHALRYSAQFGYFDIVKYLVEKGADMHARNDDALEWSAENGHFDVVKYLVENRSDIHSHDDYALRVSAEYGFFDIVKYLVEQGANIHADNDYALKWSKRNNHDKIIEYLIEKNH